jgi:hypothetical protein
MNYIKGVKQFVLKIILKLLYLFCENFNKANLICYFS